MKSYSGKICRKTLCGSIISVSCFFTGQIACSQAFVKVESHATRASNFSLVTIGDAGEKNDILGDNAKALNKLFNDDAFDLLVFLGDNFYKIGLNFDKAATQKEVEEETQKKIKDVLGPFQNVTQKLGRSRVHAIAGNHDYYARLVVDKSLLFGLISIQTAPVGITNRGNEREAEIPFWTYHYGLPEQALFRIGETQDSLQVIFFDSAILLRTPPHTWGTYLSALRQVLVSTQNRPQIKWRILTAHHPLYSVGKHGGYTVWDAESQTVQQLNLCDADTDAVGYFLNIADPQDLCAARYRNYQDSIKSVIRQSSVRVQIIASGHDHSLQLLYYPERDRDCSNCPKIHIVSGAGSSAGKVKAPSPHAGEFTSPNNNPKQQGESQYGFTRFDITGEEMHVRFFSGKTKKEIEMGGRTSFRIDVNGNLVSE